MSNKTNFLLSSPQINNYVKDFPLDFSGTNMPANFDPTNVAAVKDGEWLEMTAAGKLTRGNHGGEVLAAAGLTNTDDPKFPLYAVMGRTDLAYYGGDRYPAIYIGEFEVATKMVDAAAWAAPGNLYTVGTPLVVISAPVFGISSFLKYSVLTPKSLAGENRGRTVGYVVSSDITTHTVVARCKAGGFSTAA